jgi:suppressor for copper-sensitivity B
MKNILLYFTAWLVASFFLPISAEALNTSPVTVQLIKGEQKNGHIQAGVLLTIPQGWHAYAPTPPGETAAGFEPKIGYETSVNLKTLNILWPSAHKARVQDQDSYVYEGKTLIPLDITSLDGKTPIHLTIKMSFLACGAICVPVEETLSLILTPGDAPDPLFSITPAKKADLSLLTLLAIAFLGGLILNFMPCVLPVLSLKIMALIKHSTQTLDVHVKEGFFITGLGIITSFLFLALVTVILKGSGEAFGWGIHFQNPHFLLFVFLVLLAFSASLWGVFEIDLPSGWGTWLITHEGKGRIKDFLGGAFATLLATPCSAPFVGTALSFALARTISDIFLVFFFLGLGFAFPYFLVAALPARFIRLPRPGPWMIRMQKILALILAITAVWIGWILSFHLPLWAVGGSTLLCLIAISLFWIKHHKRPMLKPWLLATPLFLIAWSFSWVACGNLSHKKDTSLEVWQPFHLETIPSLVSQGNVVFVNATAGWCVTCGVNKKLVLNDPAVTQLLGHPKVVAMEADWTKQDPVISAFLQKYDRYGIPFNIVFGPQAPDGIVLPEILSVDAVQDAFANAAQKP